MDRLVTLPRPRLSIAIPAFIAIAGCTASVGAIAYDLREREADAVDHVRTHLGFLSEVVAGEIESAFREGDGSRARSVLSRLSADPALRHAVLIDPDGRISYSLQRSIEGRHISQSPLASYASPIERSREAHVREEWMSSDGSLLFSGHPVTTRSLSTGFPSAVLATLVLVEDLAPALTRVRASAYRRGLVVALPLLVLSGLVALLFHTAFTRRMRRVLTQTVDIGAGRLGEVDPLPGHDELAQLSRSLVAMGEELQAKNDTQTLMVAELDHRVKNTLASVLALLAQTSSSTDSKEELAETLSGRIRSMAAAHEALAASGWEAVDFGRMIEMVVEPTVTAARMVTSGPEYALDNRQAAPLALVLHELSTNAAKHGCIKRDGSVLRISWDAASPHQTGPECLGLRVTWAETCEASGADTACDPTRTRSVEEGTGLTLVRGLVVHEIGGDVKFALEQRGFRCTLWLPMGGDDRRGMNHVA